MAKIGNHEFPEMSIDEAIRAAKILVDDFQGKPNDINNFAEAMGHKSANSGAFFYKVADLRRYGLVESRGDIQATNLAKMIVHPKNNSELQSSINQMIENADAWIILYKRLKTKSPTLEQFRTQLMDITNDREKASKEADRIRKLYIDVILRYKKDEGDSSSDEGNESISSPNQSTTKEPRIGNNMIEAKSGSVYISIPKNKSSIHIARKLLDILELQVEDTADPESTIENSS